MGGKRGDEGADEEQEDGRTVESGGGRSSPGADGRVRGRTEANRTERDGRRHIDPQRPASSEHQQELSSTNLRPGICTPQRETA